MFKVYSNVTNNSKHGSRFSLKNVFLSIISLLSIALLLFLLFTSVFNNSPIRQPPSGPDGGRVPLDYDVVVYDVDGLLKAIDDAPVDLSPYVIALHEDISLSSALVIPTNKNITLTTDNACVEPCSLVGMVNNQNTINIAGFGVLVLDGIIVTHDTDVRGSGVHVSSDGVLFMVYGEISGNLALNGGGVYNDGTFKMSGGVIANNEVFPSSGGGGGVYNTNNGVFDLLGGVIENNMAPSGSCGGGVYNMGSFTLFNGGKIVSNTAWQGGGGVYNHNMADFTLLGGVIENNTAAGDSYGGGVWNYGDFSMSGGRIFNNTSNEGGGVHNNVAGSFKMTDGIIDSNTVRPGSFGAGVCNWGNFTLENGKIANNIALTGNGGGVYTHVSSSANDKGFFVMLGGEISGNTASRGGGVYLYGLYSVCGGFIMSEGVIDDNTASYGGGVYNHYGNFTLYSGEISNNKASPEGDGGGVYNYGLTSFAAFFNMSDGTIFGNEAGYRGGGVYNAGSGGTFTLSGGKISGNTATEGSSTSSGFGGGLCSWQGTIIMSGGEISGNAANFGGGVFNYASSTYLMSEDAVISDNNATIGDHSGGGVYNYGVFTMSDQASILKNSAPFGGGVFNEAGTFTMENGKISGNNATSGEGGGIYNNNIYNPDTRVNISGGTISDNTTPMDGGGIYIAYDSLDKLTVDSGVVFSGNRARIMTDRNPVDNALYHSQIAADVTWTSPAIQGYNNYDIFYLNYPSANYYIIYDANTGTGSMDDTPVIHNAKVIVPANEFTAPAGKMFYCWNTAADGSGISYSAGQEFSYTYTDNLTLFAQWRLVTSNDENFMVLYNGNGHTGGSVPVDDNSPYVDGSRVVVLGQGSMVRSGYTFLGWSKNSFALTSTYVGGDVFTILDDTILYAIWKQNTSIPTPTPSPSLSPSPSAPSTPSASPTVVPSPDVPSPLPSQTVSPVPTPTLTTSPVVVPPGVVSTWAVVNSVFAVVGALFAFVVFVCALAFRRKDSGQFSVLGLVVVVVLGVLGVVVFLLTEDLSFPFGWVVDRWTIVNAAVLGMEIITSAFVFKPVKQTTTKVKPTSSSSPVSDS